MDVAKDCARCLRPADADEPVAGLIVLLYWHDEDNLQDARARLCDLAACCHFAWELSGGGREASDTFFFFDIVGR